MPKPYKVPLIPLTDHQLARSRDLYQVAAKSADADALCESIEYEMYRAQLPKTLYGVLHHGIIVLQKKLSFIDEKVTIGHEVFHNEFRGRAIAYRMKSRYRLSAEEAQCELFGSLLVEPIGYLAGFDSDEQYYEASKLPAQLKDLRLRAWERWRI